jgi:hypothetical protein
MVAMVASVTGKSREIATNIGYTQNLQWIPHEAVGELVIAGDSW